MRHDTRWHTAAPLWDRSLADAGAAPRRFRQPALLRFAGESFMDRLAALLERDPGELAGHVCAAETWERPAAGWVAEDELPDAPLKLFQPAHDRFYLVAASLVCRVPGLPDRAVDRSAEERAGFVVRRIEPRTAGAALDPADETSWSEHAWIGDRQGGRWQPLAAAAAVAEGEEVHKLASLAFRQDGKPRRLHVGLIPVSGREVYEQAAAPPPDPGQAGEDPLADPRLAEMRARVVVALEELAEPAAAALPAAAAREALLFLLLDLAELLARDLADVWTALGGGGAALGVQEGLLRGLLAGGPRVETAAGSASWAELLLDADAHRAAILAGDLGLAPRLAALAPAAGDVAEAAAALLAAGLEARWQGALGEQPAPRGGEDGGEVEPPVVAAGAAYVARAVYERPRCGAAHPPEVSGPSAPFRLASFFDPEAPVRQARIRLPLDTSVKGLRRFPKSVSFLISEQLRKQIDKVEGLSVSEVEDGELNAPGADSGFGVIFVMSIPIITICALVLLMIIVQLLNIVFWWLPFFKIAIPIRLGGSP